MFIHLHNHTHYSILDALPTAKELIKVAKNDGQTAIAITDHGVMFGTIEFYSLCIENNIKPIIGCECYIANGSRSDKTAMQKDTKRKNYYHLLLLAKNNAGYNNLMKLSSFAHTEGFYYRPRIDKELLEKYCDGLICTSACMGGIVPSLILENKYDDAKNEALFYKKIFGEDFYIEIQNHHYETDEYLIKQLVKLAKEIDVQIVATNDIHYINQSDAIAHNVFLSIKDIKGKSNIDVEKLRYKTDEFYFRTQAEMEELFKNYPDAIKNTLVIANKCNLTLDLKAQHMPQFPIPPESKSESLEDYLEELVWEGIKNRCNEITNDIKQRTEYELTVIKRMGFPGYFLIVADFIRVAKELGCRVGPGRGSAAGSIVAYALNITDINPLDYDLLFERFLNVDRISMPDIDIDFSDEHRDKVINYVKNKYGENAVAQIVTFNTLAAKAVIKDIGRVLGVPLDLVNKITKHINDKPDITDEEEKTGMTKLKWNLTYNIELQELLKQNKEQIKKLIEYSLICENKNRGTGTHAAGVVIAPDDIVNYSPLYRTEKTEKSHSLDTVIQYEMSYAEKAGLIKMDFLGLQTLSIIDRTLSMVKENYELDINIDNIDFDDADVYKLYANGLTLAIFQFESSGMTEYLKQLKPQRLDELTAMNALYRPGPMANIPTYIKRKQGLKEISYLHPLMEKSLKSTFGVIVYQEQVMQLVQDLGGFSLAQADIMRRAMGKKKKEEMIKLKYKFAEGCEKNKINKKLSNEIFELILKFAEYGFNKSHSLAYSYLSYQTAWLKKHYPAEFLASVMTAKMGEQKYIVELIEEAKRFDISLSLPDVNVSQAGFVAKGKQIFFGMAGIKGVGIAAVEDIVAAVENAPFNSIFDFAIRVKQCNKRILEGLISAGAFDNIHSMELRSQLYNSIEVILEYVKSVNDNSNSNMDDLFENTDETTIEKYEPKLIFTPEWTMMERITKEKEYMGFYWTGHPLDNYYAIANSFNSVNLGIEDDDNNKKTINKYGIISGIITEIRNKTDKNGNQIAFVKLQNYKGTAELKFWSDTYSQYKKHLIENNYICCQGTIEKEYNEEVKVTADAVCNLENATEIYGETINISINLNKFNNKILDQFNEYINSKTNNHNNNNTDIIFTTFNENDNYIKKWKANINPPLNNELVDHITNLFGKNSVSISIKSITPPTKSRKKY